MGPALDQNDGRVGSGHSPRSTCRGQRRLLPVVSSGPDWASTRVGQRSTGSIVGSGSVAGRPECQTRHAACTSSACTRGCALRMIPPRRCFSPDGGIRSVGTWVLRRRRSSGTARGARGGRTERGKLARATAAERRRGCGRSWRRWTRQLRRLRSDRGGRWPGSRRGRRARIPAERLLAPMSALSKALSRQRPPESVPVPLRGPAPATAGAAGRRTSGLQLRHPRRRWSPTRSKVHLAADVAKARLPRARPVPGNPDPPRAVSAARRPAGRTA